nr:putative toxin-antitoxin system toxin component, PIN family [Pseudanabaena sp. BC1403]
MYRDNAYQVLVWRHICYHVTMKSRIVVDTSVLISALIGSTGASRELIRLCLQGEYQPLMGNNLFLEYESVVLREEIITQCTLTKQEIFALLDAFMSVCQWIDIYYLWRPNLRDEADNHLIELAIAGNAQIIATKNIKDFLNSDLIFPNLSILKPEQIVRR